MAGWQAARTAVGLVALGIVASALVLGSVIVAPGSAGAAGGAPAPAPNDQLAHPYGTGVLISLPSVMTTPKLDFMYSSGISAPLNIPLRTFATMGRFSKVRDALPKVPAWVDSGTAVWAPDVRQVGRHRYVMWFSAMDDHLPPGDTQDPPPRCLGFAVASSPYGPFVSDATQPAICQWSQFGDIDPRTFVQDGQEYLLWKSDDNAGLTPPGHTYKPTKIWSQKLASDGTTLEGHPVELLTNSQPWEGLVVEAPDMVAHDGHDYLFFSSTYSFSTTQAAGIGVTECRGPSGPCGDGGNGPWLSSNVEGEGPNEESLFEQGGQLWLLYNRVAGYAGALPDLTVGRVAFSGAEPYLATVKADEPRLAASTH